MASWTHFLAGRDIVNAEKQSGNRHCFATGPSSSLQVSASSISVVSPGKFDPTLDAVLLRSLSSSSLQGMSQNPSESSVDCLPVDGSLEESFGRATETNQIPRRNLTEAFEELYIDTETPAIEQTDSKGGGPGMKNMISPTGVTELNVEPPKASPEAVSEHGNIVTPNKDDAKVMLPHFDLHPELKRVLSDALVNRVSFYTVIHDINKEAAAMAANDESGYNRNPEDQREEYDPLIVAVNGYPQNPLPTFCPMVKTALIDEEKWLLDAIDARRTNESRSVKACPPTFLQAMGERDYENPLASLSNGSRTQLWKPSRSWWEAKSGKNPWIEPKSHNKRWRYLWPLIHYHKFLARCIKKLKRNGVDVKTSVSPVSVFLREEVCAVSDHLASVSLFDSDEWMNCLRQFNGWTDPDEEAEERIRGLVTKLKLRPLNEPRDVDSPLLRSQIDNQYLRAMASARAQMAGTGTQEERRTPKEPSARQRDNTQVNSKQSNLEGNPHQTMEGHPPVYPRQTASYRASPHINGASPAGLRRPRWGYPPQHGGQWWGNGWNPHGPFPFGDDASVHSALSGDSFSHHYDMSGYHGAMHHPPYYPPMMYPQHQLSSGQPQGPFDPNMPDPSMYPPMDGFNPDHMLASGFVGHPQMGHIPPQASVPPGFSGSPSAPLPSQDMPAYSHSQADPNYVPAEQAGGHQTPYKYNPSQVPMSPYWGHLDHATLAMMGIATPQGASAPQTPARGGNSSITQGSEIKHESNAVAVNAQPLLLTQQYYGYGYGNREGYGPPSPATQFMMSPQASFNYNYGYGFSPRRPGSQRKPAKSAAGEHDARNDVSEGGNARPASVTPTRSTSKNRESPSTIHTIAESESLS